MNTTARQLIEEIIQALKADGYDPYRQIQCYLDTGSEVFITHRDHAREKIRFLLKEDIEECLDLLQPQKGC